MRIYTGYLTEEDSEVVIRKPVECEQLPKPFFGLEFISDGKVPCDQVWLVARWPIIRDSDLRCRIYNIGVPA